MSEFGKEYHSMRKTRHDYKHRIEKRVDMISRVIKSEMKDWGYLSVLDVGCSDGMVLSKLNKRFVFRRAEGVDVSMESLRLNDDNDIILSHGNGMNLWMYSRDEFDIVINTAVIEHIKRPHDMLEEIYRVLRPGGILILTEANPLYCKVGEMLGYFKEPERTYGMKTIVGMLYANRFRKIRIRHFGLNPFFKIPYEYEIENVLNSLSVGFLMSNQLIVGRKLQVQHQLSHNMDS